MGRGLSWWGLGVEVAGVAAMLLLLGVTLEPWELTCPPWRERGSQLHCVMCINLESCAIRRE